VCHGEATCLIACWCSATQHSLIWDFTLPRDCLARRQQHSLLQDLGGTSTFRAWRTTNAFRL